MTYDELLLEEQELQRQMGEAHIRACTAQSLLGRASAAGDMEAIQAKLAQLPERKRGIVPGRCVERKASADCAAITDAGQSGG